MSAQIPQTASVAGRARDFALAGAFVAATGLLGQAGLLTLSGPPPAQKTAGRLDAGPIEKRELSYSPQFVLADENLRTFRPGRAWTSDAAPTIAPAPTPVATMIRQAPRLKLVAAPLPPARPAVLDARPADPAPAVARRDERMRLVGFELPRFAPTGAALMQRLGDVRSSIGTVGASIGKMMHISSR